MMTEKIEIGIIPEDCSHEETIIEIANRLDDLQSAVSYIFQAIEDKLVTYNERLSGVRERASKLENQLSYLQNNMSLKAIKMYSDAKYPAHEIYQEYRTIIGSHVVGESDSINVNKNNIWPELLIHNSVKPTTKADHYATELNLKDKLQFYYVMSKPLSKKNRMNMMDESPINCVTSVSALLIDDSDVSERPIHLPRSAAHNMQLMEDAPDSIVQPWHSSDFDSPSYLYAPILGEVPQIDVPAILPDLPGIVDDEKFVLDLSFQSPINPSSAVTSPMSRTDLSNAVSSTTQEEKLQLLQLQDNSLNLPNVTDQGDTFSSSQQISLTPPPPPPLLLSAPNVQSVQSVISHNLSSAHNKSSIANPPPPPPPPPPLLPPTPPPPPPLPAESQSSEYKVEVKNINKPPKSSIDDRTNLMAAIRAAGGVGKAKLRPAKSSVEQPSDRWSSASVGGDLMADLHAKLALRRKGIAGGGMGALERISRLIPPPPKPLDTDRNSASECDSQPDADDWE